MAHTTELNWGKPLSHIPPPSPVSQDAFCPNNCGLSTVMFDSTVTQYLNLLNFRPEKFFTPLDANNSALGVVIGPNYELSGNTGEQVSRNHLESWTWLPAYEPQTIQSIP